MTNTKKIGIEEFLDLASQYPIVDVRTPAEHQKGSIPGSFNVPIFDNNQRAEVGTIFKQKGQLEAVYKGLDFVGPGMSDLLKKGLELAGDRKTLLVHCWRGGMRSSSIAWLFSVAGIQSYLLDGGYKEYRNYILNKLSTAQNIVVLGGLTGSGKTDILKMLVEKDEQVIDLEGLANHRGSAFGAIGMPPQPSSEHFANILYKKLSELDTKRRIFVEDESLNIGTVFMPTEFYSVIRNSRVIAVMCDAENRMPRLLKEYGSMPPDKLKASIDRIRKRLGNENANNALAAIDNDNMAEAIRIVLAYYDKSYSFGLAKRQPETISLMEIDSRDVDATAISVIKMADKLKI